MPFITSEDERWGTARRTTWPTEPERFVVHSFGPREANRALNRGSFGSLTIERDMAA